MKTGRSVGSLFASDRSIGGQRGTARHLYRQGTGTEHVRYAAFGELRPPVPQSAQELEIGYRGWQWDSDAQLFLQGSQPYDPYTGRWLREPPLGLRTDPTNAYTVSGNSPLGSGTRHDPSISHQGAASWTDSFGESYGYYLNPVNDYRDGNYVCVAIAGVRLGFRGLQSRGWLSPCSDLHAGGCRRGQGGCRRGQTRFSGLAEGDGQPYSE